MCLVLTKGSVILLSQATELKTETEQPIYGFWFLFLTRFAQWAGQFGICYYHLKASPSHSKVNLSWLQRAKIAGFVALWEGADHHFSSL